jgi:AcrR family transcriptional regulator
MARASQPPDGLARDDRDLATRQRLVEAGARLFAERGFSKVTVREICRSARANVAAINYHFGGKKGLYDEIVQSAIRTMHGTTEAIQAAGEGKPPEEQLRIFVRIFLTRVVQARDGWIHHLMAREFNDPTPALDLVVTHVVKPRMAYLGSVIAKLLGCRQSDPRVEHCVMSVQAQCLILLNDKINSRLQFELTNKKLEEIADHISTFSLAGIGALK